MARPQSQKNSSFANLTDKILKMSANCAFMADTIEHFNKKTVLFCLPFWQKLFENYPPCQMSFWRKDEVKAEACIDIREENTKEDNLSRFFLSCRHEHVFLSSKKQD